MRPRRPGPVVRRLLRAPARLYDWRLGWLLGQRFLRLTHRGRRSGRIHQTVLEVIGRSRTNDEYLVMAGLGRSAQWYRNLLVHPGVEVAVGCRRFRPRHRVLDEDEAAAALAAYERRHRLLAPVLRRVLSRLVGWGYDATPEARRRLVRELPVVAFRPDEHPGGPQQSARPSGDTS